jgi:hypothetical protein
MANSATEDGAFGALAGISIICISGVAYLCIIAAGPSTPALSGRITLICFINGAYLFFACSEESIGLSGACSLCIFLVIYICIIAAAISMHAFAAGISIICFFGVAYLCIIGVAAQRKEIPSRPRFAASAVTFLFALVGFLLVFFAACGQPHIVVGGWDSGAAAAASDALPAHMRAPAHRSMGYPDSEIWIGPTIVSCWGKNKRACAKNHIFSPVAPPEPQALWTDGATKLTKEARFIISKDICGQVKGKDESDRSSYDDKNAPPNRAFWSGASHAQARVLDALCGGRFRASRDNLSAAGYAGWIWLTFTAVALIFGSEGHDGCYLLPVVLCSIMGALALAAHDHWAGFVDVVKPAYPHRSVELGGWPPGFTLIGGIMLLCAAFSSLVAFLGSRADWKFPKTTPEVSEPVAVASGGAGREPVAGVVVESWVVEERPAGWWSRLRSR